MRIWRKLEDNWMGFKAVLQDVENYHREVHVHKRHR
jgi:hypothetical protein